MSDLAPVLLAAAFLTWLMSPLCAGMARRLGIVDSPDVRKRHRAATPYFGGVAVFAGIAASLVVASGLASSDPAEAGFASLDRPLLALLSGAGVIFALGLLDDVRPVRARYKMLLQGGVAVWMWSAGIRLESVPLIESAFSLNCSYLSLPLTVLWIVGITNAVNLIDGLDGLAAGIGAIAAAAIAYVAFQLQQQAVGLVLAALAAALVGFLVHNRHPARLFLGDAGSLLIGFLLATCAVTTTSNASDISALGVPLLALAVPILDLSFTVIRRLMERRGIFSPDRNHVHYRLQGIGFTHGQAVTILWAESGALTVVALLPLWFAASPTQQATTFVVVALAHLAFFRFAGAVRLRESIRAFRAAARRTQDARRRQREYDNLDLQFRQAHTLDTWWHALEHSAERLGCVSVQLELPRRTGGAVTRGWRDGERARSVVQTTLEIPDRRSDQALRLHVGLASESLEGAAESVAVLSKLLDRYPASQLGKDEWRGAAVGGVADPA